MKGRQSFTDAVCLELENWGTRATLTDSVKTKILGQYVKIISVSKSCINYDCNFSDCFLRLVFVLPCLGLCLFPRRSFFCWCWGLNPQPWVWDAGTLAQCYILHPSQELFEEHPDFILRRTCTVVFWHLRRSRPG